MKTIARKLSLVHLRLLGLAAILLMAAPPQARAAQVINGLKIQRAGHTATRLPDGNILVVGGENGSGPVCEAEIFDPASRTFSLGAGLMTARAEHTATRLSDGRVLVIGGRTLNRLLDATEIYDPETRSFSPGPVLDTARAGHTATLLPDGRVVVVGGDSGGSVEVFDPAVGAFQRLEARLAVARRYHAAALLKDGTLLIAGGNAANGAALSSAELLDTGTLSFSASSPSMRVARSGLTLRVLPDGKVQAIGGDAEGTMEMFNPTGRYFTAYAHLLGAPGSLSLSLRTQTRQGVIGRPIPAKRLPILGDDVVSLNNDFLDRTDYSLTEIPELGQALGAGGIRTSGSLHTSAVLYASSTATVTTDKTDYSPGETITITGTGWQPEETVSLNIHRDTNDPPDTLLTAVADASGNIQNSDYVVQDYDLWVSFLLTATGQSSGYTAETTFTDGGNLSYSPTNQSLTATAGGAAVSFIQTVTSPAPPPPSNNNGSFTATLQVAGTGANPIPAAWVSTSKTPLSFPTAGSSDSWTVSFTVPAGATAGTYTADIKANPSISGVGAGPGSHLTLTVNGCSAPTITTCAPAQSASAGASCQAAVPDFTGTTVVSSPGCTATVTQSPTAGTLVGLGPHTITITATNASGTASCDTTFTVNDTTPPTIGTAADVTAYTGPGATACEATVTLTPPSASDNCTGVTVTSDHPSTTFPVGTTTVTWTATDGAGLTATSTQKVTVADNTPPTIGSAGDVSANTGPSATTCDATVTLTPPSASDNCPGVTVTSDHPSTTFRVGTTTVTWTAKDAAGNTATSTQKVTVVDNTPPAITAPGAVTVYTGAGAISCSAVVSDATLGTATAVDNCDGTVSVGRSGVSAGNVFPVGTTTITYSATDSHTNTATKTQTVTVIDNTPPTVNLTQPADVHVGVDCTAPVPAVVVSATDNCPGTLAVAQDPPVGTPKGPGTWLISVTVTDTHGNPTTTSTNFTVINDTPSSLTFTSPTGPLPKGSATVSLNFTDEAAQVHTCAFSWDDGSPDTNPPPSGLSCSDSHLYNAAGVYSVTVTVTDDCGKSASSTILVVIYDPNAGFVTGGGFIVSPAGSYVPDPTLTGKANFGFVSKYQKGANVPTGETEFQFQVANFNFHSSLYQWLVISGAKAQYKGSGTVNNAGNYGFLLTATDGQLNGGGVDKFRIKIWDNNNCPGGVCVIVYDNVLGGSDDIDSANPLAIAGGSIVIHK